MPETAQDERQVPRAGRARLRGWIGLSVIVVLLVAIGWASLIAHGVSGRFGASYTILRIGDGKPHFQALRIRGPRPMLSWERYELHHMAGPDPTTSQWLSPDSLFSGPVQYHHDVTRVGLTTRPAGPEALPVGTLMQVRVRLGVDLWLLAIPTLVAVILITLLRSTRECVRFLLASVRGVPRGFDIGSTR